MRIRSLLAALAALALVLGTGSGAAHAQEAELEIPEETIEQAEEESDLGHEEFECLVEQLESLAAGEAVDTCEEAPNPILPEINEVIWAILSFAVLFGLLAKFAFPAIRRGLEGREQTIRDDLEAAQSARREADETLNEYRQQLAEARNEAGRIIEEARQAADGLRREVQENAEAEAASARERAQAEIDQAVSRARSDLQRQVGDFAVQLAERIVERNLDRETQQALIDEYIQEVGGMSPNGGTPSDN